MRYIYIIMTAIFILCLNLWVQFSDDARDFYEIFLKPVIEDREIPIAWTIGIGVVVIIVWRFKINEKNKEIQELDIRLKSEMEILIQANTQLNKYQLRSNITNLLDKFMKKNPYVIAVQMYEFQDIRVNRETIYKFVLDESVVTENVNINAIQQIYYKQPTSVITRFEKARKMYIEKKDPIPLAKFVTNAYEQLSKRKSLDEEDIVLCSLMFLGLDNIKKDFDFALTSLSENEDFFLKKIDKHRTGILRGALSRGDHYTFTHTRENSKHNRQYLTRLVRILDKEILFLTALDASILEDENYYKIMGDITEQFETVLNNLEIMYNKDTERKGD